MGEIRQDASGDRNLDYEKDSLHIMPLCMVPLETPGLLRARMIKNVHFNSMIEVFKDEESGSGQIDPSKLGRLFDWPPGEKHPDGVLVAKLSLLQSFDVYSLRIQLRSLGIEVEDNAHLRLSDSKRRVLDKYMRVFTKPLMDLISGPGESIVDLDTVGDENAMLRIVGEAPDDELDLSASATDDVNGDGIDDINDLFQGKDRKQSIRNMKQISKKLKIILPELPDFLTDYGDVFLSLAYFKDQYDAIATRIGRFLQKVEQIKYDDIAISNAETMAMLESVKYELKEILIHIAARLETFDQHTSSMWENLNGDSFRKVKILIESNHSTIGGMLCGLHIKMEGYEELCHDQIPSNHVIVDYIAAYIYPGIERIKNIERSSRFVELR